MLGRDLDRVRLLHACVSDRAGLAVLHRAVGSSSLLEDATRGRIESIFARKDRVAVEPSAAITLDQVTHSLLEASWGGRVGFIKVDVQGAEHLVLRGAAHTIRKHLPYIQYENTHLGRNRTVGGGGPGTLFSSVPGSNRTHDCSCVDECFCIPIEA